MFLSLIYLWLFTSIVKMTHCLKKLVVQTGKQICKRCLLQIFAFTNTCQPIFVTFGRYIGYAPDLQLESVNVNFYVYPRNIQTKVLFHLKGAPMHPALTVKIRALLMA
jgi:hypothetical protein